MRLLLLWIAALAAIASPALAQTPPQQAPAASEPLKARIAELIPLLKGEGDFDAYFAQGFRDQIPKDRFAAMNASLIASAGPPVAVEQVTVLSPWSARLQLGFRDATGTVEISVSETPPHPVQGLALSGLTARAGTIDEVVAAVRGLRGVTGFALARLGDGPPHLLASHAPDTPLGVGSAFKLVILAELVRATNAGERKWTDMVARGSWQLPGGAFTMHPPEIRFSLYDLAAKMISVSDNSATDLLIHHLGREKIERMLPMVGIRDVGGMRPFLTAMEMFKLKGLEKGALAPQWIAADEAGRRAMLAGPIAAGHPLSLDPTLFVDGKPRFVREIEWFASPGDLVRVMDWLRRNTAPGSEGRAILSINPSLPPPSAAKWRFVGFKGGSEPGLLNLTWLLEGKDGAWYALTASWTDPQAEVELTRLLALMGRAADLTAP